MTREEIEQRYNELAYSGDDHIEFMVRRMAEAVANDENLTIAGGRARLPIRTLRGYRDIEVLTIPGYRGSSQAYQLVLEEQIREAVRELS